MIGERAAPKGPPKVAIVDTGVNPWHSHVGGWVAGVRVFADETGAIREDGDFRDAVGHGTAVAGIIREALPDAEIYSVRVFGEEGTTFPALAARGILRAAASGAKVINLSFAMNGGGAGEGIVAEACRAAIEAGCTLVASGRPGEAGLLPASVEGVIGVVADDALSPGVVAVVEGERYPYRASGSPRDLAGLPRSANLWGHSFACARVSAHLAGTLPDSSRGG